MPINKTDERRLHVAVMRMLRCMGGVTKMDKVKNGYISGSLKVPVDEKLKSRGKGIMVDCVIKLWPGRG